MIQSARGITCKDKSRHNLNQAKNSNNSDIVTVSSASIDTCNVPQPLQKMRDNNYQILSVAGMHAISHQENAEKRQSSDVNIGQNEGNDTNGSTATLTSGQQVQFLAHL